MCGLRIDGERGHEVYLFLSEGLERMVECIVRWRGEFVYFFFISTVCMCVLVCVCVRLCLPLVRGCAGKPPNEGCGLHARGRESARCFILSHVWYQGNALKTAICFPCIQ